MKQKTLGRGSEIIGTEHRRGAESAGNGEKNGGLA